MFRSPAKDGKPQKPPVKEIEVPARVRTSAAIQTKHPIAAANDTASRARHSRTRSTEPSIPAIVRSGSQALERVPQGGQETSRG